MSSADLLRSRNQELLYSTAYGLAGMMRSRAGDTKVGATIEVSDFQVFTSVVGEHDETFKYFKAPALSGRTFRNDAKEARPLAKGLTK